MTRLKRSGFNLKIAVIIPLHLNLTARWHVLHQFPGRSCPGLCNLCDGLLRNRAQIGPQFTPICSFNDRSESNNILLRRYLVDFSSNRLMCKTLFISCFYCQILILSTKNNFIHAYTTKFITFKRYFRYLTSYLHVFNGHIYHEIFFLDDQIANIILWSWPSHVKGRVRFPFDETSYYVSVHHQVSIVTRG